MDVNDAAASFQAAVIDILRDRTGKALALFPRDFPRVRSPPGGGGRRGRQLRHRFGADRTGREPRFPSAFRRPALHRQCGDDCLGGLERFAAARDPIAIGPRARWPLDALDGGRVTRPERRKGPEPRRRGSPMTSLTRAGAAAVAHGYRHEFSFEIGGDRPCCTAI